MPVVILSPVVIGVIPIDLLLAVRHGVLRAALQELEPVLKRESQVLAEVFAGLSPVDHAATDLEEIPQ